jgi:carboxymethylenebutenolidase
MQESRIEAQRDGGVVDGRLFVPEGGRGQLVVQIMDAGGLRPAMSRMAEPLTAAGYTVLQPNLYWRHGDYPPFDARTVFGDPKERERLMEMLRSVKSDDAMADIGALLDAAGAGDRFACVGYCLGGRMAFVAASAFGERVVAAASVHGGGLVSDGDDSPHLAAGRIRGALYLAVSDADSSCTPEHQATLRAALDAAGVRHELELFDGTRHGFAMPDFPVFDEAAAARHWQKVLALFRRELPPG